MRASSASSFELAVRDPRRRTARRWRRCAARSERRSSVGVGCVDRVVQRRPAVGEEALRRCPRACGRACRTGVFGVAQSRPIVERQERDRVARRRAPATKLRPRRRGRAPILLSSFMLPETSRASTTRVALLVPRQRSSTACMTVGSRHFERRLRLLRVDAVRRRRSARRAARSDRPAGSRAPARAPAAAASSRKAM